MLRNLLAFWGILLVCSTVTIAKPLQSLYSPDKKIQLVISQKQEHIIATVLYQKKSIIPEIRFGIQEQNQTFYNDMKCLGFSEKTVIQEQYPAIHGKRSSCSNIGNAFTIYLENTLKQKLNIEFRVYNDGVCFRYALSEEQPGSLQFTNEFTTYHIHREADRWMQKYIPHYEGDFPHEQGNISQGEWG